jgi:hypothetical protein
MSARSFILLFMAILTAQCILRRKNWRTMFNTRKRVRWGQICVGRRGWSTTRTTRQRRWTRLLTSRWNLSHHWWSLKRSRPRCERRWVPLLHLLLSGSTLRTLRTSINFLLKEHRISQEIHLPLSWTLEGLRTFCLPPLLTKRSLMGLYLPRNKLNNCNCYPFLLRKGLRNLKGSLHYIRNTALSWLVSYRSMASLESMLFQMEEVEQLDL